MIKVLHVITGLRQGGAETALYRLLAALQDGTFQFRVVSLTDEGVFGERIARLGVPVDALHMPPGRVTMAGVRRFHSIVRDWQPDITHAWMYHANLLSWLIRPPGRLIWGLRQSPAGWQHLKRSTRLVIYLNALAARLSARPQVITVNSQDAIRRHVALGFPEKRLRYIPNGFDLTAFSPSEELRQKTRAALGLNEATPLLGLFARLHPVKGHAVFFAAARKVLQVRPDVRFVLCGKGLTSENPQVQAWLPPDHRDAFFLQGLCREMPRWYAALDGLVLSSFTEGFPNVLGEAMACGVPCVSTDVGDAAEIIGETGFVVPPGDVDALADAMLRLIALSPDERRALGLQARQRIVANFSLENMAQQYAALYRRLV